jgi:hypothetical protein
MEVWEYTNFWYEMRGKSVDAVRHVQTQGVNLA